VVFENAVEVNGVTKPILKATVSGRYGDKDGEWKSSQSFSRNKAPLAIYCLAKAFDAMVDRERREAGNACDVRFE